MTRVRAALMGMAALSAMSGAAGAQQAPIPLPPADIGQPAQPLQPAQPPKPAKPKAPKPPADVQPLAAPTSDNKIAQPFATFSGLDKITGRIISFDVAINETVQFGALQVTPRVCYSRPQTVAPLTTSFVEVDEITLDSKIRRIFTGWMFADSPGLHAVEHAVYDVWLTDCKASSPDVKPPAPPVPTPPAKTP